ncbi:hypothetical protein [Saccharopolyspora gloriosae]|uniref:Uncharacterized protein n=1 Tax=Saccharopolyspora gloriosae TaxID=455344 RepID=A0A840NFY9_9PSEU|nr:hypothetical protein [Saccharopolyspora gloriosae]MBB5070504.1 hypothetical protein [Saccharopolyspora gloriosae]
MIVELERRRPALPGPGAVRGTSACREHQIRTTPNSPKAVAR